MVILVKEMKGRLCISRTELKPGTILTAVVSFCLAPSFLPLFYTLTFSQQCLPEMDTPVDLSPTTQSGLCGSPFCAPSASSRFFGAELL